MAIQVFGGEKLSGEIPLQGSKNAALPLMAASLLCDGETVLTHYPRIRDVEAMQEVMQGLGSRIYERDSCLHLDHGNLSRHGICRGKAGEFRASILLMGSCLSRFGEATIAYPGGCAIGERPIDFHIQAFRAMGAVVEEQEDAIVCRCPHGLHGTDIVLPFPSVGATENIILAAVRADGTTTIQNAAREPEIVELCRFLKKAGAKIRGEGSTHISIEGQHTLRGVFWRLCDDRIVFLTFAMLVAGCGGELFLPTKELFGEKEREVFCRLGGRIRVTKEGVVLQRKEAIHPIPYLCTGPYPAFSTDGQSLLLPVLARANGVSTIEERIFENRFQIIGQLRKMGANIDYVSNRAQICGVTRLHGADVTASDLRSGAGLLIAAAMADGSSRIEGTEKIERGYEDIVNIMCRAGVRARSV